MTRLTVAGGLLVSAFLWSPELLGAAALGAALLALTLLVWRPAPPRRPEPVTVARVPTRFEQERKARWVPSIGVGIGLFGPFIGLGFWRRRR